MLMETLIPSPRILSARRVMYGDWKNVKEYVPEDLERCIIHLTPRTPHRPNYQVAIYKKGAGFFSDDFSTLYLSASHWTCFPDFPPLKPVP